MLVEMKEMFPPGSRDSFSEAAWGPWRFKQTNTQWDISPYSIGPGRSHSILEWEILSPLDKIVEHFLTWKLIDFVVVVPSYPKS